MPIVTLTTDFGARDPFVGLVKGAILSVAPVPETVIVDLTHEVPPRDVMAAALTLPGVLGVFPRGSIHVAVIDPGVGSHRAAVAVETESGVFVGPDNGVFSGVLRREPMKRAVRLDDPAYHRATVSATFHGRDIFAPVAGHLAAGVPLERLGSPVADLVHMGLPNPRPIRHGRDTPSELELHVLFVDRFGNLITDLTRERLAAWAERHGVADHGIVLRAGGREVRGIRRTYDDVPRGEAVAYFGSAGWLEIGVRDGDAAAATGLARGDTLRLSRA